MKMRCGKCTGTGAVRAAVVIAVFLGCGLPEEHSAASDIRSSGCHGFASLAKTTAFSYEKDSADYCSAEKIRWEYDASGRVLHILHTRKLWNCAAEVRLTVTRDGDVYTMVETDERDKRLTAMCMCYFDTYGEIEGLDERPVTLRYEAMDVAVDPAEGKGVTVIDTSCLWPCD